MDKEELRKSRNVLLNAFDIYKSNVEYGLITETKETHNKMIEWYNLALDLDEGAINNYPDELNKYL